MVEVGGNQAVKLGAVQKLVMTYFSTVNPTARFQQKKVVKIDPLPYSRSRATQFSIDCLRQSPNQQPGQMLKAQFEGGRVEGCVHHGVISQ